eukprot:6211339-Pleurochrysis_carterae.AAC.4
MIESASKVRESQSTTHSDPPWCWSIRVRHGKKDKRIPEGPARELQFSDALRVTTGTLKRKVCVPLTTLGTVHMLSLLGVELLKMPSLSAGEVIGQEIGVGRVGQHLLQEPCGWRCSDQKRGKPWAGAWALACSRSHAELMVRSFAHGGLLRASRHAFGGARV